MHCALRLKSEPWLNLNLLFLSSYWACRSLIHLLSFIPPTVCVRGRLGWRAFTQDLSGTFEPSPSAYPWPAALRSLCNVSITALCKAQHRGAPPSTPRHWVPGLCQHAMGRLIRRGDTYKSNMTTAKISGTVLSQQISPLWRGWERKAEGVTLSRGNYLESQI